MDRIGEIVEVSSVHVYVVEMLAMADFGEQKRWEKLLRTRAYCKLRVKTPLHVCSASIPIASAIITPVSWILLLLLTLDSLSLPLSLSLSPSPRREFQLNNVISSNTNVVVACCALSPSEREVAKAELL